MPVQSITSNIRKFWMVGALAVSIITTIWAVTERASTMEEIREAKYAHKETLSKYERLRGQMEEVGFRLLRLDISLSQVHRGSRAVDEMTARPIEALTQRTKLDLAADPRLMRLVTKHHLYWDDGTLDPAKEGLTAFARLLDVTTRLEINIKDLGDQLDNLATQVPKRLAFYATVPVGVPASGKLSSNFGMRNAPFHGHKKKHEGIDIANDTGTPIVAPADGVVRAAHVYGSYGKYISLVHGEEGDLVTRYGHLDDIHVKRGDRVKKGQIIGTMGSTGRSTGPHLHYEVQYKGHNMDPHLFMEQRESPLQTLTASKD